MNKLIKQLLFMGIIVMLVIGLLLAGCAKPAPATTPSPAPAAKAIKLRYTGGLPPTHHMTAEQKWFAAEINKRTNGLVTVETYIGGELYKHAEVADAVGSAAIEMGYTSSGHFSGRNPIFGFYNYFFLMKDQEHTIRAKPKLNEVFAPLLDEQNCKVINWLGYGDSGYIGNKPVVNPPDIKGLMVRGMNPETVASLKALGAVGVTMAETVAYDAIAKGALDGTLTGFSTMVSRKQYEIAKYAVGCLFSSPWFVVINLDLWKKLPSDIQKTIMQVGKEAEEMSFKQSLAESAKERELLKTKLNLTILNKEQTEAWIKFARPTWDEWLAKCEKAGWGKQAREVVKILDETR